MSRFVLTCLAILVFATTQQIAEAQSPLSRLPIPFRHKVDADPNADYQLTESNGPWLIMAASFLGDEGEQQARQLILELRKEYNMPAYLYKQRFDYSGDVQGRGFELDENNEVIAKRMKHQHLDNFEEIAVLIGDFATVDDAKAQSTLEKIKVARPKTIEVSPDRTTYQRMGVWREIQRLVQTNEEIKAKGPMRAAFLLPNPLLPDDYFNNQGPDEFIMELNKHVDNSLLDCPGKYTVRVATFRGDVTFNVKEIEEKKNELSLKQLLGKPAESKLAIAGEKAHRLTEALRKRGVEAYEFHDRYESFVCVGSFNSVGTRRDDGKTDVNPEIYKVIEIYKSSQDGLPGIAGVMTPKSLPELRGITFDLQPVPVQVPRASLITRGQSHR